MLIIPLIALVIAGAGIGAGAGFSIATPPCASRCSASGQTISPMPYHSPIPWNLGSWYLTTPGADSEVTFYKTERDCHHAGELKAPGQYTCEQ